MTFEEVQRLDINQLKSEIERDGRFVCYTYTISIIFMTFRRPSNLYFLRADDNAIKHGWKYMLLSLVLGWWGIPWGLIYTLQSLYYAFSPKEIDANDVVDFSIFDAVTRTAEQPIYDMEKIEHLKNQ